MTRATLTLLLPDPDATRVLGDTLARQAGPGDVYLLDGPIGSGKTHLARAFLTLLLTREDRLEDIPSPTFTLVQVYEIAACEIWHADLYRLSHPQEVIELGLDEAFRTAICLVEWPDRLGELTPPDALHISFTAEGEGRRVTLSGTAAQISALAAQPDLQVLIPQ